VKTVIENEFAKKVVAVVFHGITWHHLDFSHPKLGQDSGSDPKEAFLADEVEGVIEGHDGAEGSGWSPGVAAPPEDFDLVAVAGWAQARDWCAGSVAEERVAAPGAAGLDSTPGPGMGLDAVKQGGRSSP